jgi:malectin (di-glucose binding ER protein)
VRKLSCDLAFIAALCFPAAALAQQPLRVNCSGPAYVDSKGHVWSANYGFNSGSIYSVGSPISGTPDQKLFQKERYGDAIIYSLPVANGSYTVNIYLAEIYYANFKVGGRVMNIKVQGALASPNVDIFAQAGANAALTKSTSAVVSNGTQSVELDNVVGGAKCSAIEILPVTAGPSGPPLSLNFKYPDGTPVAGTLPYTVYC